ncbi:MAG: CoA protein activase [Firmicutes bacterium]|nr:CoA protein activase [Bacillota bacterium]
MKISFPRMGNSFIAFKMLINSLGHEAIVPPAPSERTLSLGVRYAPEFACIPFKILLGTYLEAIELGTEMIITSGGVGPCRAGYYGVLHQMILNDLGHKVKIMVIEPPLRDIFGFIRNVKTLIKPTRIGWRTFWHHLKTAWEKLVALDDIERISHQVRPYEVNRGETTKVYERVLQMLDEARNIQEITEARVEGERLLRQIPCDYNRPTLKVGIIGEIYVVIEPFANHDLQVTLESMGVETQRAIYLSGYTRDCFVFDSEHDVKKAAAPYLNELIGGHGINSVGETVLYARHGFDGVVQLAPFACIPEIVAKSILPKVSHDLGIPVLTLFIDEQTGKAGIQTRLEAFVDLLWQRRQMMEVRPAI